MTLIMTERLMDGINIIKMICVNLRGACNSYIGIVLPYTLTHTGISRAKEYKK